MKMEPEHLFSWRWHSHAVDPKHDYAKDPITQVSVLDPYFYR